MMGKQMGVSKGIYSLDNFFGNSLFDSYSLSEEILEIDGYRLKAYITEFWTSKQRQASSIHEVSYRACFKPQLPNFFIQRLTSRESVVFDPFLGRGTTIVESALNGRVSIGMDVNPLSEMLTYPRINIPRIKDIFERIDSLELDETQKADIDLSMFYHPNTESQIVNLKGYLNNRHENEEEDNVDKWIRMVATNRLTGHSSGFFSVYTLPPNQATTQKEQLRINEKRGQKPDYRDIKAIIKKKTLSLLKDIKSESDINKLNVTGSKSELITEDSRFASKYIEEAVVDLTVTSPPFLNLVQYAKDNWLRCWFNNIDISKIEARIFIASNIDKWRYFIKTVLQQLYIVTKKGGYVAFEVGEVRNGTINLDEYVALDGISCGFQVIGILINKQNFTKTSNIWGVDNLQKGTNTNRVVLFKKGE
jgi:DNA modification methylase